MILYGTQVAEKTAKNFRGLLYFAAPGIIWDVAADWHQPVIVILQRIMGP